MPGAGQEAPVLPFPCLLSRSGMTLSLLQGSRAGGGGGAAAGTIQAGLSKYGDGALAWMFHAGVSLP